MPCCCSPLACATGRLFSRFARRYHRRYLRRGLEPSQRQLVAGVMRSGDLNTRTVLEIGCGVGYLHQTLLKSGAQRALGIDLSERMLIEARALAAEQGLAGRCEYRLGDFVELAADVPAHDVTVLDKVVCCYPDAEALVRRSLAKTRRVYALTYPRNRRLTRFGVAALALLLWIVRSPFRTYVHDPRRIEAWITGAGFSKRYQRETVLWLTQVYAR